MRKELITLTLIKLLVDQGYYEEAGDGLKILCERLKDKTAIPEDLLYMKKIIQEKKKEKLKMLMHEWVRLIGKEASCS